MKLDHKTFSNYIDCDKLKGLIGASVLKERPEISQYLRLKLESFYSIQQCLAESEDGIKYIKNNTP